MQLKRGSDQKLGSMILRGTMRMIGGRVMRMLITLVGMAILARLLTPADFGVVAVAVMILPLATALLDGLIDVPTVREDGLNKEGLGNLIWTGMALMAVIFTALWLCAPLLASLLNSPTLADVLRVLCFGLFLQPFIVAGNALLRRQHRFGATSVFMPISAAVYVLVSIGLALLDFGVWSLIIGQLGSLLITAIGLGFTASIPFIPPRRLHVGAAWNLGGLAFFTRLMAWISSNIDTLFASAALGPASAGVYSRAYNITTQMKEPFAVLDQTIRQAFVAQRNVDDAAASRSTQDGLRLVVIAAALVSAGSIVMRDALVAVLLGSQWGAVVLPFSILATSLPARVARLYLDGFAYARGSMRHMLIRNTAIALLLIIGLWMFAANGVVAIALVMAATHVATLLFQGGSVEIAVAGTIKKRLTILAPGYAAGVFTVALGELSVVVLPGQPFIFESGIRLFVFILSSLFVLTILPEHWMPAAWSGSKKKLYQSILQRLRLKSR